MDFEQQLQHLAANYAGQGYQVTVRPTPDDLPPFAQDFRVELVARRAAGGVLVAVKQNRDTLAADVNLQQYAEITSAQPGWRFDLAILDGESRTGWETHGTREFSPEAINKALTDAEQLVRAGFLRPAVISAWAGLEAAMRMRLRANGEKAGRRTSPRVMLNELYSTGVLSGVEFRELEKMSEVRNQIVHGFESGDFEAGSVRFLSEVARRLMTAAQPARQPA